MRRGSLTTTPPPRCLSSCFCCVPVSSGHVENSPVCTVTLSTFVVYEMGWPRTALWKLLSTKFISKKHTPKSILQYYAGEFASVSIFKVYIQEECCLCDQIDHFGNDGHHLLSRVRMACCAAFLGSVLHQCGLSRPGHTPSGQPWGQHTVGGSLPRRAKHKWAGPSLLGFPVGQTRRNKVAELWESSRALLQEGVLGEEPEGLMKVRKHELERRWSTGSQSPVQPYLTGAFSWMWNQGLFLKSHLTIWRNGVL